MALSAAHVYRSRLLSRCPSASSVSQLKQSCQCRPIVFDCAATCAQTSASEHHSGSMPVTFKEPLANAEECPDSSSSLPPSSPPSSPAHAAYSPLRQMPRTPPSHSTPHPATPASLRHRARSNDSPGRNVLDCDSPGNPPARKASRARRELFSANETAAPIASTRNCIQHFAAPSDVSVAKSDGGIRTRGFIDFLFHPMYLRALQINTLRLKRLEPVFSCWVSHCQSSVSHHDAFSSVPLGPQHWRSVITMSQLSVTLAQRLLSVPAACAVNRLAPAKYVSNARRILSRLHPCPSIACFSPLPACNGVQSAAIHPILPLLVTGSSDNTTRLWRFGSDAADGSSASHVVYSLQGHTDFVKCIVFHPSLPIMATGSRDRTAKLWLLDPDGSPAAFITTLHGHASSIKSLAFHSILPLLLTGSSDNTARLWRFGSDAADGSSASHVIAIQHQDSVKCVASHPSLPIMATGSRDKTAELLFLNPDGTLAQSKSTTLHGHSSSITGLAFHSNAPVLVTSSYDGSVRLWKYVEEFCVVSCVATLSGLSKAVLSVAFHPNVRNCMATGHEDQTAKLWQLEFSGDHNLVGATCKTTLSKLGGPVQTIAFHARLPVLMTSLRSNCTSAGRDALKLWY